MPVAAVALAVLLHGAVAAAIWWANRTPTPPPVEDVIQVSFEQPPTPPKPPPQPTPQKAPEPPRPTVLPPVEGLRPPADIVAEKATQAPPKGDKPRDADLAPPPPPIRDTEPARDPPSQPAQTAMVRPEPIAPPPPTAAKPPVPPPSPPVAAAPPRAALAPPGLAGSLPRPPDMPPLPAPEKAPEPKLPEPDKAQKHEDRKPAAEQKPPAPAIPQHQAPKYAPSPLSTLPSNKPPAGTKSDNPSPSPFVNPADTYSRAKVADNYLWQVVRRLQGYRYTASVNARQGLTVVRVVIARDGRLLDVKVTRSSGYPEFDNGVLQGVRSGSPYAPLPPEIKGDSAAFDLPLVSVNRGG